MKVLYKGEWLSVRRTPDNYEYVHQEKMGGEAVAVLGYAGRHVLGRYEVCPPHGRGMDLCALTGGIEADETPAQAAARELTEESGFEVGVWQLRPLGTARPSKASDTLMHLFCARLEPETLEGKHFGPGDGTIGEVGAYCRFVTLEEALFSKDPLLATMAARRMHS